jgi:hypothetical protein
MPVNCRTDRHTIEFGVEIGPGFLTFGRSPTREGQTSIIKIMQDFTIVLSFGGGIKSATRRLPFTLPFS